MRAGCLKASIEAGLIEPPSSLRCLKYVNARKTIVYTSKNGISTRFASGLLLLMPNTFNIGTKMAVVHDSSAKMAIATNAFVLNFSL